MIRLNTLGPEATDSWAAAVTYSQKHPEADYQIVGHASFETILENLAAFKGERLLLPAAFKSLKLGIAWGDVHYLYLRQMTLIDSFVMPLNPLLLVENTMVKNDLAYTHAATGALLLQYLPQAKLKTAPSKYLAYQEYKQNGQYVLTNEKNVTLQPYERILAKIEVPMVWCLYQIRD